MKDLKHLIYFENLLQEANNELVQQARAEGEHALGYTCYFVPETLLNLPGCFSSRLRAPNTGSIDVGTYYMSSKICSYTRSILERGIEGGYDYLDALLSSETCQMMHRGHEHFEILGLVKEKNPQFFMSMMDVPFSDEDFAVDHYEEQLRVHVLEPLHEKLGIDTSDEALMKTIERHNEVCRLIPTRIDLKHQHDTSTDAAGHVKSTLIGVDLQLIIHDGKLLLGSSQGIYFLEFDGPRKRSFYVQVMGE